MRITLFEPPFSAGILKDFEDLAAAVFGSDASPQWLASLGWRMQNMPDVTLFMATEDGATTGFKAGYATAQNRYYSWLGGVVPSMRNRGVASGLMHHQHTWLLASRFNQLECHVEQANTAMIDLNLKSGLAVSGFFMKDGHPYVIMHKEVTGA